MRASGSLTTTARAARRTAEGPSAAAAAPALRARDRQSAVSLSDSLRYMLRMLIARPSASRTVGAGEVEQLDDNRQHPVEVAGAGLPLQHVPERTRRDPNPRVAVGVDDIGCRQEDEVDTFARADLQVGIDHAGVAREVLTRAELQRVEKDRHNDVPLVRPCPADQRRVSFMERAHRHDHTDAAIAEPRATGPVRAPSPSRRALSSAAFNRGAMSRWGSCTPAELTTCIDCATSVTRWLAPWEGPAWYIGRSCSSIHTGSAPISTTSASATGRNASGAVMPKQQSVSRTRSIDVPVNVITGCRASPST